MQNRVFIGLGANLGDRAAALKGALAELQPLAAPGSWKVSSIYETRPVAAEGGDYLNAVCAFETALDAQVLHAVLAGIEAQAGRIRTHRNAPRTLDLDLLFFGTETLAQPALTVPHPRLHERAFVLIPLAEIAPDWQHPVLKQTAAALLEELHAREVSGVKKYDHHPVSETISSRA